MAKLLSGTHVYGNLLVDTFITATGNVTSSGNVSANYFLGNGALLTGVVTSVANINFGNSNVTIVSSGGNIAVGVGGTSNVAVFATTGEYVSGVVSASGNITGANINTAGNLSLSGGIKANNTFGTLGQVLTANGANGTTWTSQFYVGNAPPQAQSITPNYGDVWYYVSDDGVENIMYMWVNDGTSSYFYDFLPPTFP